MLLRRESGPDKEAIAAVHAAAFARPGTALAPEVRLVDELRESGHSVAQLSLVAELDGRVVGHVVCSRARIDDQPSLGLGPLGVLPDQRGRGVGSALMHAVVAAADALDAPAVVLLGAPDYYRRFGFRPAGSVGVLPPDPRWVAHFQIRLLAAWTGGSRGVFHYAPAFDHL